MYIDQRSALLLSLWTYADHSKQKQFTGEEIYIYLKKYWISLNMDRGNDTALIILYLSAAFDNIDCSVLLAHLFDWPGIAVTELTRFGSFLANRCHSIKNKKLCLRGSSYICNVPSALSLDPCCLLWISHHYAFLFTTIN